MTRQHDIIIVGAGPVGLTLSALMARAGLDVVLLEGDKDLAGDPRASTFHAPTLDMLDSIGAAQPILDQGVIVPRWQIRMHPQGRWAEFDMSVLADETRHPYRVQCEQAKLTRILADDLANFPNFELRYNHRVSSVEQVADETVLVRADTPNGGVVLKARYVIGTDGARSAVRRALGFAFDGMTYEEKTILVTTEFRFEDHMPGLTSVAYCWNKDSNFSLLKVPGHWRVAYTPPPDMTLEEALQPDAIQRRLHDIIPRDGGIAVLGARGYTSHLRIVEHYRRGHIVLAGDAAHLHSSAGGTGMNGGIHDAFCLAEYLRAIFKDGADESVLDQYEARRRPVTAAEIIPLADANRKRMREKDPAQREKHLAQMQYICADRDRMKAYLMKISMLDGVRMAGQLLPASVGA